jgi:hypothetical protein
VLLALTLRTGFLIRNIETHPYFFFQNTQSIETQLSSGDKPYVNDFGYEAANIACAMVCKGEGFASPFGGSTGPTAWAAPGIVLIYALSFYAFGCFTFSSILFMFLLSLLFSAAMVVLAYRLSFLLFENQPTACICAALVALCPHDLYIFNIMKISDFNIFSFLFLLIFCAFIEYCHSGRKLHLLLFSFIAGISILFNPVFICSVLSCFLFLIFNAGRDIRPAIQKVSGSLVIMACIITPYIAYQNNHLHALTFIKSNSLFELYIGNTSESTGELSEDLFMKYHPSLNTREYHAYRAMGEVSYVRSKFSILLANFNFQRFVKLCMQRFLYFFFIYPGADSQQQGWKLLIRYLTYPLTGLSLLLFLAQRWKGKNAYDPLWYAYMISYALPFLCTGVMWRYSLPLAPLAMILLGKSLAVFITMFKANSGLTA